MRTLSLALLALVANTAAALAQDAEAGERVYAQCKACHQIGEGAKNLIGPQLNGLFGRKTGTIEGYNYSEANKNANIVWSDETFRSYIVDPKGKIPGTKMTYAGLKNERQVNDLVAYIKQFDASGKKN